MLLKCCIQYANKFGKLSSGHFWISSAHPGERQVMQNLRKTQRQSSKKDGTGGLKTLRVKSPSDQFHITFIELLLCRKYLCFFENMCPMFPVISSVNVFLLNFCFFLYKGLQIAGSKDLCRNIREMISACTSSVLTCTDPVFLSPHLSSPSTRADHSDPSQSAHVLWLIVVSFSCYFFSWFYKDIWQIFSHRPQDWKIFVFIPISKKSNAEECSNYCTIVLISHVSKVMLKILQVRLQQYVN